MHFLQFKKKFKVSLLPLAFNNVMLGDLMFVKSNTRPISVIPNSPSHIYNLFRYQALISKKKWRKRFFDFKATALIDTPLLEERITASPSLINAIEDDFLKLVLLNFEQDTSVVEIAFSRLEQKEMSLKSKKRIRRLILRSPKEEGEAYQRNILTVAMATRLYYGNLCFITDEENAQEIERLLLRQTRQPLHRFLENGRHVFEFAFKENPFCMHLELLTDYGAG
mgnify:FL=1